MQHAGSVSVMMITSTLPRADHACSDNYSARDPRGWACRSCSRDYIHRACASCLQVLPGHRVIMSAGFLSSINAVRWSATLDTAPSRTSKLLLHLPPYMRTAAIFLPRRRQRTSEVARMLERSPSLRFLRIDQCDYRGMILSALVFIIACTVCYCDI